MLHNFDFEECKTIKARNILTKSTKEKCTMTDKGDSIT